MSKRNIIIALTLLVLAVIAGLVLWNQSKTRQLETATLSRISTATQELRAALVPAADADAAARAQAQIAGAARIDKDLTALRDSATSRIPALAAGADIYLHTTRELLRRQIVMLELRKRIGDGIVAFRDHMLTGNRAAARWTTNAVTLKNRLEQDYREYRRTVDAYATISNSYPEARKALTDLVPPDQLVDAAQVAAASDNALAVAASVTAELDAVRQSAAPR